MFLPGRYVGYGKAVARWIAAGRPVRTDAEVRVIFHTHCRRCDQFDPERQKCRLCGCRVAESGPAYRNKLKMATERCPRDPPLWTEEVETR